MAISLRGSASNASASANSNLTVTLPGGTAQNDVVYAAYGVNDQSNTDRNCATVTAGYTELADLFSNDTNDSNLGVYRKVQGSTPDSTVVFSGVGLATWGIWGAVEVLTGVDTTTPEDATTTTATGINGAVPDPPSITTVTAGAWVIAIGACTHQSPTSGCTAPTNYTNLEDDWSNSGWGRIMMATRNITAAGAEDPGVFTLGGGVASGANDSWCAASVAVRPGINAFSIAANAGSYSLSGTAATPKLARKVAANTGAYAITGQTAALKHGWKIAAGVGGYVLTGADVTLTKASSTNKTVVADAGAYGLTGVNASLLHTWKVAAGQGGYSLTGAAANLRLGRKVAAASGAYNLTGSPVTLRRTRRLAANAGGYALTGATANLLAGGRKITASPGGYSLIGAGAGLVVARPPVGPGRARVSALGVQARVVGQSAGARVSATPVNSRVTVT